MRMEQNSRGTCGGDLEQFSRFLRGNRTSCGSNMPKCDVGVATPDSHYGDKSLAMVYAVKQPWQGIYDPEIALINGTIFEGLNKPFYPTGCASNNGCRGKGNGGCVR
jgi:hypothetical protein